MKTDLHPHQREDAVRAELLRLLPTGEVLADEASRGIYSTDASIYQFMPVAVVTPRHRDDIATVLKLAREFNIPTMMRGGGTSLAGQCANSAIIIDTSKHMNKLLEINAAGRWARVQPGFVRDELNKAITQHGLEFAPETSTSNRAVIGGMIANNSSGMRSIRYGRTSEHVLELTVMLATGDVIEMKPRSPHEVERLKKEETPEGRLWRSLSTIIDDNRDLVARRFPKVMRRVGGYSLDAFPVGQPWNLSSLISGSEGTLGIILEAKVNLVEKPKHIGVLAVHFHDLREGLRAAPAFLKGHDPLSVELVDYDVVTLARANPGTRWLTEWVVDTPHAILAAELTGDSDEDVIRRLDALEADLKAQGLGYAFPRMIKAEDRNLVVELRKQGLGILLSMKGDLKPIPFIEDAAVPPEHLADYLGSIIDNCNAAGVRTVLFGHASVGVIHIRPVMNLKDPEHIKLMRGFSKFAMERCKELGGSWSGEHGDGIARGAHNVEFWGEEMMTAFRAVKKVFDPQNLMNPGRVFDTPPMNENLRYGADYHAEVPEEFFRFEVEQGFVRAVEMCNGVGACRKTMSGTMCPSYMATRDEEATTRGRANALRLAISGQLGKDGIASERIHEVLDLCLECKACKSECPSAVDMAKMKSEHLQHYHDAHGPSLRSKLFAEFPRMASLVAGPLAILQNTVTGSSLFQRFIQPRLGIAAERKIPALATQTLGTWFKRHAKRRTKAGEAKPSAPQVVLFADCWANYEETNIGKYAVRVLEHLGYEVVMVEGQCCQRTRISKGYLRDARHWGARTIDELVKYSDRGIPVVGLEPSCVSAFTDDLPDLVETKGPAERLAQVIQPIEAFLAKEAAAGRLTLPKGHPAASYLIHGHCHQKSLFSTTPTKVVLAACANGTKPKVSEVDSGCCGMAGSFGYEAEHYAVSQAIGGQRLFPAVKKSPEAEVVIANGTSCRHQIEEGTGRRAMHAIEAIGRALLGEEA